MSHKSINTWPSSMLRIKHLQWSLRCKTAPSAGLRRSLVGVRSHIRVHFVLKILLGAEGGRSHKTSWSYNKGFYNAGITVYIWA